MNTSRICPEGWNQVHAVCGGGDGGVFSLIMSTEVLCETLPFLSGMGDKAQRRQTSHLLFCFS